MNSYMGTRATDNGGAVPFPTFLKRSEFAQVPRSELLVFTDEHADSLSFSMFHLDHGRNIELWCHLPAARHSRSGVISYTDGHAEIHRWKDPRTVKPEKGVFHGFDEATGNRDWKYLWLIFPHWGADFRGGRIGRNSWIGATLTEVAQPPFVRFS